MNDNYSDPKANGMCPHGNFPLMCPTCDKEVGLPQKGAEVAPERAEKDESMISREWLSQLQSLNVKIETDLTPLLDVINKRLGLQMQHRAGGFHVTVFGPTEKKLLDAADDASLAELQSLNDAIRAGQGVEVLGLGVIDGAVASVPAKDKEKKVAYLALNIPSLNAFRAKFGLPSKDFHATLGFEGGDIHMAATGEKDAKGKEMLSPITKKADGQFAELLRDMPDLQFGGISGEAKEKKQEKAVDAAKEARQRLRDAMSAVGLGGKDLMALGVSAGPELGKIGAAIEASLAGGTLKIDVSGDLQLEIAKRIEEAKKLLK